MVGATTPVEVGLVKTLARPGGNVTGVTIDVTPAQAAKLVELMVEIPGVSRIAVLSSPAYPGGERYRSELERRGGPAARDPLHRRAPTGGF